MVYLSLILALILAVPAVWADKTERKAFHEGMKAKRMEHHQEMKEGNKAFRESLKGKTKEEKIEAMKAHHEENFGNRKAFNAKMHDERMAELKERLGNLGAIPKPFGFTVSCLPVKVRNAGAGWARVVAIL